MQSTKHERINITLPSTTLRLMERAVAKGNRSKFIDQAVREYAAKRHKAALVRELEEGYRRRADEAILLAQVWEPLETW